MDKKDIEFLDDLAWEVRAIYDNFNRGKKKFKDETLNEYIKRVTYKLSRALLAKYDDELQHLSNDAFRFEKIEPTYKDIYELITNTVRMLRYHFNLPQPEVNDDPVAKELHDIMMEIKEKYESHCQDTTKVGDTFDPIWHIQANNMEKGEKVMGNTVSKIKKQGKSLLGYMVTKAEVIR